MLIEIVKSNLSNRGFIIESKNLPKYLTKGEELYRSYFGFDEKIKEHFINGIKSPSGFIGNFYLNHIVLDIDKGKNTTEFTILKMRNIANRLIKEFDLEDNFQVWFSGTGFHIHLPNIFNFQPSNDLPEIVKSTIESYFPEADTSIINPRGLIRVGRSINLKSNLYKIPIKENEIWFTQEKEIFEYAKTPRYNVNLVKFQPINKHFTIIKPQINYEENLIKVVKPNRIVTCMQHCFNAGEVIGTRHKRILSMVSWLYREGIPYLGAIAMMKVYAPSMENYEIEKTVSDLYKKGGYNYSCDSEIMKHFCDPDCIFYTKKNYLPDIFGTEEIEKEYIKEVKLGWQKNSLNLAPFFGINDKKGYWLRPGHLIGIQADTGNSKSALMQNIVLKFRDFGKFLYVNTEMPHTELFERFIQIEMGISNEEIRERYFKGLKYNNFLQHIEYTKSIPDYAGIVSLVTKLQPKILIIDVIDDIKPGKDRTINSQEDMYAGLKDLSRKQKVITFLIHHINKSSAIDEKGNNKILNAHSGKGSSAFEQKCDVLIGIEGIQTQPYRRLRHLKGRSTTPFEAHYYVDSNTFIYKLEKV